MTLNLVDVQVTLQTSAVSQVGFGVMCIVGTSASWGSANDRIRLYNSMDEVSVDFDSADPEYVAAEAAFGQTPRVEQIAIGWRDPEPDPVGAPGVPEPVADALDAINAEDDDWYALVLCSRDPDDVKAAASWVGARMKIFGTATADAGAKDASSTTDILAALQTAQHERTFCLYHQDADTEFPEAAWLGQCLPEDPGSINWALRQLSGVAMSPLSATEINDVLDKNGNVYVEEAGSGTTYEGRMVNGEFIDIMRLRDWLTARIKENVILALKNPPAPLKKIPYTNHGAEIIGDRVRRVLAVGVERGAIATDPPFEVIVPNTRDMLPNDRANRYLPDIRFNAVITGAVNRVQIRGILSV